MAPSALSAAAAKPPPPSPTGTKLYLWSLDAQDNGVFEDIRHSSRMGGLHTDLGFWNGATRSYGGYGGPGGLRTVRGNTAYDPDYQLRNSMSAGHTVDGPTPTIFPEDSPVSSWTHEFVSHPVANSFTLSGSVAFNFSSAQTGTPGSLNAGFVVRVYKLSADGILTLVVGDAASTEIIGGIYSKYWTAAPTTTAFEKGDRIALFVGIDDAGGNMSDGIPENGAIRQDIWLYTDGETANQRGDSWIQLGQNVTFDERINFSGSTLYLGDGASSVSGSAGTSAKEMSTTQGSASASATITVPAGPVPLGSQQWRTAPGGNAIEWYSKPLGSFVLSGPVLVAVWGSTSNYTSGASVVAEISVVNGDGSSAQIWGRQLLNSHLAQYRSRVAGTISGRDYTVVAGQRLRLRLFLDDNYTWFFFPLVAGHSASLHYGGANETSSAGNNSFIRLQQTVSESSNPPPPPPPPPPSDVPQPPLLDNFNRSAENPVSQSGNWSSVGINGGAGAPLSQNQLKGFPQPGYSFRVTPYLGGDMEAAVTITTRPGQTDWLSVFICLQDAGTTGWDGYELRATNVNGGPDRWEVLRVDNGQYASPLASTNFEIAAGGTMLLRRVGDTLQFWWKPPGGSWGRMLANELGLYDITYRWGMIGAGGAKSGALDDFSGGSLLTLLDQYAPELRFTSDEVYRSVAAQIATDLWFADPYHTNLLKRPDGSGSDYSVAAADPNATDSSGAPLDDLSPANGPPLDYLSTQAQAGDFLDQPNYTGDAILSASQDYSFWVTDANHQDYNRVAYGREIPDASSSDKLLQFWIFYYYNPKRFGAPFSPPQGWGTHEGDWEWIQIRLDAKGIPTSVSYSQHGDGESCDWGPSVEISSAGHPVAYVAQDSHANYFWPGDHTITEFGIPTTESDRTADDGQLYRETPRITQIPLASPPGWIAWDGYWGASFGENSPAGGGQSPKSPGAQDAWRDPSGWEAGTDSCSTPPTAMSARLATTRGTHRSTMPTGQLESPPLPRIRSARVVAGTRYSRAVRVQYCFRSMAGALERRPWRLRLTVDNLKDRFPPLSHEWPLTKRCGTIIHPVGGIKPPYVLRYSVGSRSGTWSKQAQLRVK